MNVCTVRATQSHTRHGVATGFLGGALYVSGLGGGGGGTSAALAANIGRGGAGADG